MCSEGRGGAGGLAAWEVSTIPPAVLQTRAQVTRPPPTLGMSWASPTLRMGKPSEAEPALCPALGSHARRSPAAGPGVGGSPGTPSGGVCGTRRSADSEACLQHLALPPSRGFRQS